MSSSYGSGNDRLSIRELLESMKPQTPEDWEMLKQYELCLKQIRECEDWMLLGQYSEMSPASTQGVVALRTFEDAIMFVRQGGTIIGAQKG